MFWIFSLTDYTDNTDIILETRIKDKDFRNKDLRILGFRGFNRPGMNRIEGILQDLIGLG